MIEELGGIVREEYIEDPEFGVMVMVTETTRANFTLIELVTEHDHWDQ